MARIFKDFCGTLNEESVRRNFALLYELLEEIIDAGYPQLTTSDQLKLRVHNEAVVLPDYSTKFQSGTGLSSRGGLRLPAAGSVTGAVKTVPSNASHRPVGPVHQGQLSAGQSAAEAVFTFARTTLGNGLAPALGAGNIASTGKNEIFVDIFENLTVALSANGRITNSHVDGCIQMKSYLAGSPALRLGFNEDLVVKSSENYNSWGAYRAGPVLSGAPPALDDCNFHECVDTTGFEQHKELIIRPPDGEFVVMNYRITDEFHIPFLIKPSIEVIGPDKFELYVEVRANLPAAHYGGNLAITCPIPKQTQSVTWEIFPKGTPQTVDFRQKESKIIWNVKKIPGGTEVRLRAKLAQPPNAMASISKKLKAAFGPIFLTFEIPMFNVSNLQVRYLRLAGSQPGSLPMDSATPSRWVRYVTQSASYICRF